MGLRDDLIYVGSAGESFDLGSGPVRRYGKGDPFREREWDYDLGANGISNASRASRKVSFSAVVRGDLSAADRMADAFDADVRKGAPGAFRLGGWECRAYVTKCSCSAATDGLLDLEMEAVLLGGVWYRAHSKQFLPVGSAAGMGKGYPHGYPYAYGAATGKQSMDFPASAPGPVRLVVYGPATNPSVTAGGNVFQVKVSVPTGGRLEVDGRDLTCELVSPYGQRTDALRYAVRGTGAGSGEYVFEEVGGGGDLAVTWDGSFGFDLTAYEKRGEPTWT